MNSPSYKKCNCGADCDYSTDNEPCWGKVDVVDDYEDRDGRCWLHGCKGHEDCCYGENYKPEK